MGACRRSRGGPARGLKTARTASRPRCGGSHVGIHGRNDGSPRRCPFAPSSCIFQCISREAAKGKEFFTDRAGGSGGGAGQFLRRLDEADLTAVAAGPLGVVERGG